MNSHRRLSLFGVLAILGGISACAAPGSGANWTCSANGLITSRYDGSGQAYVHLSGFTSGGHYPVKLNEAKTEASGVTANGTPFTCKKA
ncbi:hypothetical protein [Hydrogenophaga sp.]|uniref:hypothetical protein n=1 Tax=Hydrogenophaga sp. TaxID=1904254 RepID=UPI003D0EEDBE